MPPSAIVFDAYGTLLDVEFVATVCREVDRDAAGFAAEWRRQQLGYTWLRNSMRRYADFERVTADALEHVAERRGLSLTPDVRARLLDAWLHVPPHPDVPAALDHLAAIAPLAILSNGTPRMLDAALGEAGLRRAFAEVLSVDAVGVYKPDPRVYALATERLAGSGPLVFVSANGWDVAGASAAGLQTVFLNRVGLPEERLGERAWAVVAGMVELPERVRVPPAALAG